MVIMNELEKEIISYVQNLIRDCARQAKIWDKAYTLPSIPDGKCNKFFELVSGSWHGNNT